MSSSMGASQCQCRGFRLRRTEGLRDRAEAVITRHHDCPGLPRWSQYGHQDGDPSESLRLSLTESESFLDSES